MCYTSRVSHPVTINKQYSIYGLVNSRGSVEVFTSYYSSNIILHLFFIYLVTHCHSDLLATLHIWYTAILHVSSSYRRLRRAYTYHTHLLPLLISYIVIVPGSTLTNISSSYRRLRLIVPAANICNR